MMTDKQMERVLFKLDRLEKLLEKRLFTPVAHVDMQWYKTAERLHAVPEQGLFTPCTAEDEWGGESNICWFRGTYTPDKALEGKTLFAAPKMSGYEAMLWVDGEPTGIFAAKFIEGSHGNHYCDLLALNAKAGQAIDIAVEFYSGTYCMGCMPYEDDTANSFRYKAGGVDICVKDAQYNEFYFDLKTVNQLVAALDDNSFRRADVLRSLLKLHEIVYYSPDDVEENVFRGALQEAHPILKEVLSKRNSESAPFAGLIGHSHMDTAWLWTIPETEKKCARTYANQLSLMAQYPEYLFVQSSAAHGDMIRRNYPGLFKRIQQAVKEGRYEPNGGVWVECDCNIPSGEMMARQFLWGQRFTRKYFDYTSDCFWLPDTFGYSAAIPQIMKLSGVDYFLTTKIDWNDTTKFPYDSFYWKGIDGSSVLTHFNKTHIWPEPKNLVEYVVDGKSSGNCLKEKTVTDMRLLSFGFGDGGGGPQFEMLEMARRIEDVEGLPKSGYTTVSGFMQTLEETACDPSVYSGELYLELHRGTLTNQHQIKRNNRLAEIAMHDLEYATVRNAVKKGAAASGDSITPLINTLLVNQFHDILPGTCIPPVHEQSIRETTALIGTAKGMVKDLFAGNGEDSITVNNTSPFARADVIYLDPQPGKRIAGGYTQQLVTNVKGEAKLAVLGVRLDAYSAVALAWEQGAPEAAASPFLYEGDYIETTFAKVEFDEKGAICSLKDRLAGDRELCDQESCAWNTFLMGEDLPAAWDNWDVDADIAGKFRPVTDLISRELISDGGVELRVRSVYRLSPKSTLTQDMIFCADSPIIKFETLMDWQDHHRFLKTAFDTALHTNEARHEIQFGYVKRPTTRNNAEEKAKFEICAHKYSDLSETRYGVALLNDCKYALSAEGASLRLSLHKGGQRPDFKGDLGLHECAYAVLPHGGAFSAETVVKPAYLFNYKHTVTAGAAPAKALLKLDCDNIVAETVKPCEDSENAFILRLYECEGAYASTALTVPGAKSLTLCNLLEEGIADTAEGETAALTFRPFEIKTVKVLY